MEGYIKCKLKEVMDKKGVTRYRLSEDTGIRYMTIDRYYKNVTFRYDATFLAQVCYALECEISDLLEYVPPPIVIEDNK